MKKIFTSLLFVFVFLLLPFQKAEASPHSTKISLFQITSEGSQQNGPKIFQDEVIWTDWRNNTTSLDVYKYNLKTKTVEPLIVKNGQQVAVGLDRRYVIYNEYFDASDPKNSDIWAYDRRKDMHIQITDQDGSQQAEDYHRGKLVYIDGGACGTLYAYNLIRHELTHISDEACSPARIYNNFVVWSSGPSNNVQVHGFDLKKKEKVEISNSPGFNEAPDIFGNKVVWLHRDGNYNAIMMKNIRTGRVRLLAESEEYTMDWPAISGKYVVWGKSTAPHITGVEGIDLKSGNVFEIYPQGPHQNSRIDPSIWRNKVAWMAWRTGNGDIYGATIKK